MGQNKLTVKMVRALNRPGLYGDGNTLYLKVAPGGSKQWIQRLTINGKRHDIGLGGCGWVTLAQAREAAHENRMLARRGGDPLAAKLQVKMLTFREAAQRTYETLRPRWRNEKVAANWMQQLERHAFKRLGTMPVDRIGREDVLTVLTPILDREAGNGPARASIHPVDAQVVPGARVRRVQRRRRGRRRSASAHARRQIAFSGIVLP